MDAYELVELKKSMKATPPPKLTNKMLGMRAMTRFKPMRPSKPKMPKKRDKTWRDVTAGDAASYGYAAYKMAKQIISMINVEEKIFDVDGSSGTVITSTPTVVNLSNIAQGVDYFNRVGNSIRPQDFEFRCVARGSTLTSGSQIRLLLVQDKENQGVDPTMGEVLAAGTYPILQPYNPLYKQRFRILYDECVQLTSPGVDLATSGTSTNYIGARVHLPVLKMKLGGHIRYDGTTGADASNVEGALFLMAVSLDATNGPNLSYTSRLVFTDD